MGSALSPYSPPHSPCDLLSLSDPGRVLKLHRDYLKAGADILTTNTFNSNRCAMTRFGLSVSIEELNRKSVSQALLAADEQAEKGLRRTYICGLMGAPAPSDSDIREAFREQSTLLVDSGADALLIETIFDLPAASQALEGIRDCTRQCGKSIPLLVSATLNSRGELPCGGTPEDFAKMAENFDADYIGLNCGDPEILIPHIHRLRKLSGRPLMLYPSAGIPQNGHYPVTADEFALKMAPVIASGEIDIAGGCCGATPEFIRLLRAISDETSK